jgi:hypothetical protein
VEEKKNCTILMQDKLMTNSLVAESLAIGKDAVRQILERD